MENLGLWSAIAFTFIFTNSFAFFILTLNRLKARSKVAWQLNHKLESSFLLMDFTDEESKKKETERSWLLLLDLYRAHYIYFEKYLLEEGYKNRRIANKWKKYVNYDLKRFLILWEKYDHKDPKWINAKTPESFFDEMKEVKKISKKFLLKVNPKAKTSEILKAYKSKKIQKKEVVKK